MTNRYILDGQKPMPCEDLLAWAEWIETADRTVSKDKIVDVEISTVFLGLDHSFGCGPPLLFETMVFGGPLDQEQTCYTSWEAAEAGHDEMVGRVRLQSEPEVLSMSEQIITIQAAPHSCEISRNASGGVAFTIKCYAESPEIAVANAKAIFAGLEADYPPVRK